MLTHRQRLCQLDAVVARLQIQYGPRAIRRTPMSSARPQVAGLSTTFPSLDTALGIGGLPRGRLSEICGPATSGKVSLAAKVLSAAHREAGSLVAWLDLSRSCDPGYLHHCGLDLNRLLVVRPADAADALAIALHLVESNALDALVFDSLADLSRQDEARLAGTLERLAGQVDQTATCVIFLSDPQSQFRTLAHLAAVRLEMRRERWITQGQDVRGYEVQVKIAKHKFGPAGVTVPIRIVFDGTE